MTPKQFIIANSSKWAEAVENGYDIRMTESEIFEWMEKYRNAKLYHHLQEGEIIQEGDECEVSSSFNGPARWVPASPQTIGTRAPSPLYPAHRLYRRLIR